MAETLWGRKKKSDLPEGSRFNKRNRLGLRSISKLLRDYAKTEAKDTGCLAGTWVVLNLPPSLTPGGMLSRQQLPVWASSSASP